MTRPALQLDLAALDVYLGRKRSDAQVAALKREISQAVDRYLREVAEDRLKAEPLLVRGRPLGAWLTLDIVGALLVGPDGYPMTWDGVPANGQPEPGEETPA